MNLFKKSKKHYIDADETYFQHMFVAQNISFQLLKASMIISIFFHGASLPTVINFK